MKAIKKICEYIHIPTRTKQEFKAFIKIIKRLIINTEQDNDKNIIDYTNQFKQAKKIYKSIFRTNIIKKFIKNQDLQEDQ